MRPVNFSTLKYMSQSPAHYRASLDTPFKSTDAMRLGSAFHSLVLGGRTVATWFGGRRAGKDWKAFEETHAEDIIVTEPQYETAFAMAKSTMASPETVGLFRGVTEKRFVWELCGMQCAGTPDVIGYGQVTDLKSTVCASPERFIRDALKRYYHVQLAWYMDGHNSLPGTEKVSRAYIVAVESKPPYATVVYELTPEVLEMGRRIYRQWIERLRVCIDCDEWPGYVQCRVPFTLPDWIPGIVDDTEEEDADGEE